jgi:predicted dehydrogenase
MSRPEDVASCHPTPRGPRRDTLLGDYTDDHLDQLATLLQPLLRRLNPPARPGRTPADDPESFRRPPRSILEGIAADRICRAAEGPRTYAATLAAFVAALQTDDEPPVTLEDGLRAQAIADAATRALASGRTERITY